jgi:hypothetical protein
MRFSTANFWYYVKIQAVVFKNENMPNDSSNSRSWNSKAQSLGLIRNESHVCLQCACPLKQFRCCTGIYGCHVTEMGERIKIWWSKRWIIINCEGQARMQQHLDQSEAGLLESGQAMERSLQTTHFLIDTITNLLVRNIFSWNVNTY